MLTLLCVVLASVGTTTVALLRPDPPVGTATAPIDDPLASLPVSFEPAGDGTFVSRGPGYSLLLTGAQAVVGVRGGTFGLRPAGPTANAAAPLVPGQPLGGTVTRLTGDDPSAWRAGLSTYGRVKARQVWPGVDMVWHGDRRALEHDMVVAPGVDPAVVAFEVDGARSLALAPGGDLVIDVGEGATARLARPVVYQEAAGARREVTGDFVLLGPTRIGFRVGAYDPTRPLVIDPTLVTSTLLGGIGNDAGYAIAVDAQGNTYVTGTTESPDFPTNASLQAALTNSASGATSDVFVSKVSPDGGRLVWSTYLGGGGRDTGYALAVGGDGSVYVAGVTESPDFPRANPAQANYGGGSSDAFVAKLGPSGTAMEWSTFVGGGAIDRGRGMALDDAGNAYLTGSTSSADFPAVTPFQAGPFRPDDSDAFLVKIPAGGGPLAYATRLGGGNDDHGLAVAVDGQGHAYVTGDTLSPAFPTVRPVQATSGGSAGGVAGSFADAFVSKFNPSGSALLYSTFLGGSDVDQGTAIAVDDAGAAYVAGNTKSTNFPTVVPLQAAKGDDVDAFVAKLDPPGAALVYATYVGGSGADGANGIDVGADSSPVVTGTTGSANWPTTRPVQAARGGGDDAFLLKLTGDGRSAFSSFVGGRDADSGMGVALDGQGRAHVLGLTGSQDFPLVAPLQGSRAPAGGDAFVATLDVADAAGPAAGPGAAAAGSPSSSSSTGHDRRVRALGGLTIALLLAAVAQTVYLRRRDSTPAQSPSPSRPAPQPARKGSATPGLTVLDQGAGTANRPKGGAAKAGAGSGTGSKSTRTPKARGGPKTGGAQKAGAGPKTSAGGGKGARAVAGALGGAAAGAPGAPVTDGPGPHDGGPPTMATPPPSAPPRAKPQEPAIAHLLEEDLWAPAPSAEPAAAAAGEAAGAGTDEPQERPERPPAAATAATATAAPAAPAAPAASAAPGSAAAPEPPAAPTPPPTPDPVGIPAAPAIPPVPAEELSFWDLFPEDLPPARPATFPVEDLLADHIVLPEGPESAAGRLVGAAPPDTDGVGVGEEPPPTSRPPRPPEAEIVIAELLDGPPPTGLRPPAESPWAPTGPDDDFLIDDLLFDEDSGREEDEGGDEPPPASAPPRNQQARIAADRARRRRTRRGGKGRPAG